MSDSFVGEIRMFGGNFAPVNWAFCNGQLLPITDNEMLFALIGTTYGGDGRATFAVPDLRGRVPVHQGAGYSIGEHGGVETVTLTSTTVPAHTHQLVAASTASTTSPTGAVLAPNPDDSILQFGGDSPIPYPPTLVTFAGSSQPHDNLQPYVCINFIICVQGLFPSQS